jgi:transcriptional regulator with PAS, ATPase and Fis domain
LQTHTVIPVGGREPIPVDVRIVAATHRALREEMAKGTFRADLMYRLRVVPIYLPPLRARPGDIALLTEKLMEAMNERGGRVVERVAPDAMRALEAFAWPGNVRELMNVLEYAYAVGEGPLLVSADLPPEILDPSATLDTPYERVNVPSNDAPEAQRIRRAIERAAGNRTRAARMLGISRTTLWRRMKELGLLDEDE